MIRVYLITVSTQDLSTENQNEWPSVCNLHVQAEGKLTFQLYSEADRDTCKQELEEMDIQYESSYTDIDETQNENQSGPNGQ